MNGRGIDEVGRVGYEYFSSLLYFIRIKQIIILTHARKKELHVNGTQQRGYDRIENGRFISQPDTGARLYSTGYPFGRRASRTRLPQQQLYPCEPSQSHGATRTVMRTAPEVPGQ